MSNSNSCTVNISDKAKAVSKLFEELTEIEDQQMELAKKMAELRGEFSKQMKAFILSQGNLSLKSNALHATLKAFMGSN